VPPLAELSSSSLVGEERFTGSHQRRDARLTADRLAAPSCIVGIRLVRAVSMRAGTLKASRHAWLPACVPMASHRLRPSLELDGAKAARPRARAVQGARGEAGPRNVPYPYSLHPCRRQTDVHHGHSRRLRAAPPNRGVVPGYGMGTRARAR